MSTVQKGGERMEEIYTYPVELNADDNGTILVSFPDFPEAHTFGETKEEALFRAVDALATVIDAYIKDRQPIPKASALGTCRVKLPALMETKIALYESMRAQRVNKTELAKRLHWHLPQVDRLLDVHHSSRVDQLEYAFAALGKRLTLCVENSPERMSGRNSVGREFRSSKKK